MEQKDYYQILGVDENATQQQIKQAYRALALKNHPDRNKDDQAAAARMKEINESYAVLSDREKRRQYDSLRHLYGSSAYGHFRQTFSEQDIYRGSDIQQIFEEIGRAFGFRNFDEVFKESYGSRYRTFEFRQPGAFSRVFFASSQRGNSYTPKFPLRGNLGKLIRYGLKKKWGIEWPEKGKDRYDIITISPELAQAGGKIKYIYRRKSKKLVVKIPVGVKEGQRIRLKGLGDDGKGGGEPGDLYVKIRFKRPFFHKLRKIAKMMRT
jgi:curved DNA-binding protein